MQTIVGDFERRVLAAATTAVECVKAECQRLRQQTEKERREKLEQTDRECKHKQEEVQRLRRELEEEIAAMSKMNEEADGKVVLDVGGHLYPTSVATLRSKPTTMLDAMFSGRYKIPRNEADGSVFIDRDGEWFRYVLEYLRDGVVDVVGLQAETVRRVKREFEYFNIHLLEGEEEEMAFAVGGRDVVHCDLSTVERYDVRSGSWRAVAPMATARNLYSLDVVSGQLYAVGGYGNNTIFDSVERYDLATDSWAAVASLGTGRCQHASCVVDGTLYVLGGMDTTYATLHSVERYDIEADTWSEDVTIPEDCGSNASAACTLGGKIYMTGGYVRGNTLSSSTLEFDCGRQVWITRAPMPQSRVAHQVAVLDGRIYAVGGMIECNGADSSETVTDTAVTDTAVTDTMVMFDPKVNTWSPRASMKCKRCMFGIFTAGGYLYAVGGRSIWYGGGSCVSSMERYDPRLDCWEMVSAMGTPRVGFQAVCVNREQVSVFDRWIAEAEARSQQVILESKGKGGRDRKRRRK